MVTSSRLIQPYAVASSLALTLIAFCCHADNAFLLYYDLFDATIPLMIAYGIGALVACGASLALRRISDFARIAWAAGAAGCCVLAIVIGWMGSVFSPLFCAIAAGFLLAFGSVVMVCLWMFVVYGLAPRSILPTIGASCFLCMVLWFLLQTLHGFAPTCLGLIVVSLCSGVLLVYGTSRSFRAPTHDYDAEVADTPEKTGEIRVRAALVALGGFEADDTAPRRGYHFLQAAAGLFVAFFMLGVNFWPVAVETQLLFAVVKPCTYLLAVAVVFFVVRKGTLIMLSGRYSETVLGAVLGVAAVLVVIASVIDIATGSSIPKMLVQGLTGATMITYASFVVYIVRSFAIALLVIFSSTMVFEEIAKEESQAPMAGAAIVLCCTAGLSVGIATFFFMQSGASVAIPIVAVLFLALIMLTMMLQIARRD